MRLVLIAFLTLLPLAAQTKAPASEGLPAGAEKIADLTYRWKDKDGVAWLYHKSPFGWHVAKEADEKARAESAPKPMPQIKVLSVKDDVVSFEMASPFGPRRWFHKTSELTAEEKAAVQRQEQSEQASK